MTLRISTARNVVTRLISMGRMLVIPVGVGLKDYRLKILITENWLEVVRDMDQEKDNEG